jgi:GH15 family glucan-1,4-alpha-glucosidase
VIEFWAHRAIPMKSPGEWYARYDAHGEPVDAGSGARYDEPEWDSNGYFIYLVNRYHELTGSWPVDKSLVYELADFLVHHLDPNGLLYEGGIVEWTGYLPATNMIDAAALKTAANIAEQLGDTAKAAAYAKASSAISEAMPQIFDNNRQTYADVRFAPTKGANNQSIGDKSGKKVYLWDTTANVGIIWGYPDHRDIELSNVFYRNNTVGMGGGMRYFDSPDPGLAEYGHGFFFFTTAAAAEYEFLRGNVDAGRKFLDWMVRNANCYGLMPEHISPDGLHCSPASPLSWCSAEFAATVLLFSQI